MWRTVLLETTQRRDEKLKLELDQKFLLAHEILLHKKMPLYHSLSQTQ